MAYNGQYDGGAGGGRQYGGGPGPQRPPPQRHYPPGPGAPQHYNGPPPQQYDQYRDGYGPGYDGYGNGYDHGYDQGYGGQYDDGGYGGGGGGGGPPPSQDYYQQEYYDPGPPVPGRGGRPMPGGRGGPMMALPSGDRAPHSDPGANRGPPMAGPGPGNGGDPGFNGPFPSFPGAPRRSDLEQEQQILAQMEGMDISGNRPGPRGPNGPPPAQQQQRGPMRPPPNGYGRPGPMGPPPRGPPQAYHSQDYPDPRRGHPPGPGYGPPQGGGYPEEHFGPPPRSMTMPARDRIDMRQPGPLARTDSAPYRGPLGPGVPQRPSTAQGMRQPPPRIYPPNHDGPPPPQEARRNGPEETGPDPGCGRERPSSVDDFYDYYGSNDGYPAHDPPSAASEMPDFDAMPSHRPNNSLDRHMQPGQREQTQRGPGRHPEMTRAKSQPNLRNSQTAVFEMAGDIPPLPTQHHQPGGPQSHREPGPAPAPAPAPPQAPPQGLPPGPAPYRPGAQPPPQPGQKPGQPSARARSRERYLVDAQKILRKLEKANNPDAMFFLADCLGRGLFGEPDNAHAFSLYQSAAKLGHPAAAYRTAVCCEIGNDEGGGTRKDPLKAMQWYKRAATLGDTPAMYKMGMILLKGLLGQPRNPREAISWLKRAAERATPENPHALHELALLYESAEPNDVILRDEAYAFQLFKKAAELGYKFSQFRLGCAYEYGLLGCPIDPRLSIMWYSRAAVQEEHQSELALSGWYLTGSEGVLQQSDTEAYLWARKAAMAGLSKAEYAMGYFTEVGIGVPANLEDAKRWYWRAAAQDFPKARERLEELKRSGKTGPRNRERISRSKIGKQQEGECSVM
ncbi:hypothetical protein VTH06DRAFT_4450 [Thermothelomyces fergusii]